MTRPNFNLQGSRGGPVPTLDPEPEAQCDVYAGDPGASAPRCESYRGHPGRHFIRQPALLAKWALPLDAERLADVLTELHITRDGVCSETHRPDAEFVAIRYAARSLDPDPLTVPEPQPAPRRRSGCGVLPFLALLLLAIAAPQGAAQPLSSLDPARVPAAGSADVWAVGDTVGLLPGASLQMGPPSPVGGVPQVQEGGGYFDGRSNRPTRVLNTLPVAAQPSAQPMSVRTGNSGGIGSALIGGWATYYADPKQPANARYAAAGPLLREALGDWRGKVIAVTSGKHSTIVQLVDVCACGERQGVPTLIDLSPAAFRDLAPLSAGVIRVEIELVALPATDVAP